MKYCVRCNKKFYTDENICPICSVKLSEIPDDNSDEESELEVTETVSSMTITGIL